MKIGAIVFALLFSSSVPACVVARVLPSHIDTRDQVAVNEYLWKESFTRNPVVISARVTVIRRYGQFSIADLSLLKTWKTDGAPIEHIYVYENSYCQSFSPEAGKTYVLFARRAGPMLEHVSVRSEPIRVIDTDVDPQAEAYLDRIAPIWVTSVANPGTR